MSYKELDFLTEIRLTCLKQDCRTYQYVLKLYLYFLFYPLLAKCSEDLELIVITI